MLEAEHFGWAREVVELYTPDSGNGFCYELLCIIRWFLFLDLARRENLSEMFCLDSDYILFCDLTQDVGSLHFQGLSKALMRRVFLRLSGRATA